ncbi:MAG: NADH-quinone oxidoreductase subunit C [Terracidiphilus sp.]
MTVLENVIENPAPSELWNPDLWTVDGGVWWMKRGEHDQAEGVREVALAMNAVGARFITITAYQLPGAEGFRLEYHWDLEGRLLGFGFNIAGNTIQSIVDFCEAADWIEREVHEGFGIDFTGREYEPLLLREGDTPGVNLRDAIPAKPAAGAATQEVKQ